MEIDYRLDVREISPRIINGWSDVRFSDDESTSADFFEAVKQAIAERACAVLASQFTYNGIDALLDPTQKLPYCHRLMSYPVTENTFRYELIELIENAIYEISPFFLCGIGDASSGRIRYPYRNSYADFPFFLGKDKFGINDDIAFFRHPNIMATWPEMRSCGYAYRLMNAISAMTSLCIYRTRKIRSTRYGNYVKTVTNIKSWNEFIAKVSNWQHNEFVFNYKNYNITEDTYMYGRHLYGFRLINNPTHTSGKRYGYIWPYTLNEVYEAVHPGSGIGADCLLRTVSMTFDTYENASMGSNPYVDSYVENIKFFDIQPVDPILCYHNELIYSPVPHVNIVDSFSPSVLPPDPKDTGTLCYQYGQIYLFNQYFDFGIPGGFRFR